MKEVIYMVLERETKGAVRYQEVDSDGKVKTIEDYTIGTLYVRKSALEGKVPQKLTLTVEAS